MRKPFTLNVLCALECELRPLIRRFNLEPVPSPRPFRIWTGESLLSDASVRLRAAVSGIGPSSMAAAVGFLAGLDSAESSSVLNPHGPVPAASSNAAPPTGADSPAIQAWLNLGVAGHRTHPLGAAFLAAKVTGAATGRAWYPQPPFAAPCPFAEVLTVPAPETAYPADALYDMEAAAFFAAASPLASAELIHALKIVSDNAASPPDRVSAASVASLIESNLALIECLFGNLAAASDDLNRWESPPPALAELLRRLRFTVTERHQLERQLRRWQALSLADCPLAFIDTAIAAAPHPHSASRGAAVIRLLRDRLDALPVHLAPAESSRPPAESSHAVASAPAATSTESEAAR